MSGIAKVTLAAYLCTASATFAGTTYYAAPNGGDTADCLTPGTAGTLSNALSRTVAGTGYGASDTVVLAEGDYLFTAALTVAKNYLTIMSAGGDASRTTLVGGGGGSSFRALAITGPARIEGSAFSNFVSSADGFALYCNTSAKTLVTVTNCLFAFNACPAGSTGRGAVFGGLYTDCTFTGNTAVDKACFADGVTTNCIVLGNTPSDISGGTHAAALYKSASVTLADNCIQAESAFFAGDAVPERPYAPQRRSKAVDAGLPLAYAGGAPVDFYGQPRFNGTIDIGCAEYFSIIKPTVLMVR